MTSIINTEGIEETITIADQLSANLIGWLASKGITATERAHPLGFALDTDKGSITVVLNLQDISGWADTAELDTLLRVWPTRLAHYEQFTR